MKESLYNRRALQSREVPFKVDGHLQHGMASSTGVDRSLSRYSDPSQAEQEIVKKQMNPCILVLPLSDPQLRYLEGCRERFFPVTEASFPWPYFRDADAEDGDSSSGGLSRSSVIHRLQQLQQRDFVFFMKGVDCDSGIYRSASRYEFEYQYTIVQEEVRDLLGLLSCNDGYIPFLDYASARISGQSAEALAAQLNDNPAPVELIERLSSPAMMASADLRTPLSLERPAPFRRRRVLFGNDPATSVTHRQDKGSVQSILRKHGLPSIRQIVAHSADEAEEKLSAAGMDFPVVTKPVAGAGSEYVTLCHDLESLRASFQVGDSHTSLLSPANHMTVEEYIVGQEYVVDTVGYEGRHVVTDVWRSWKVPHAFPDEQHHPERGAGSSFFLYDRQEFIANLAALPPEDEARRVVDYTLKVLDVLGMRNGSAHCEVRMDTRRQQPVLIELNPRFLGDVPRSGHLVGYDQMSLLFFIAAVAAAYPEPEPLPWPPVPQLYRSLPQMSGETPEEDIVRLVVFLQTPMKSAVCPRTVREIMDLATFASGTRGKIFDLGPSQYVTVAPTVELRTYPGAVILQGTHRAVRDDYQRIRQMEARRLCPSFVNALLLHRNTGSWATEEDDRQIVAAARSEGKFPLYLPPDVVVAMLLHPCLEPFFFGEERGAS